MRKMPGHLFHNHMRETALLETCPFNFLWAGFECKCNLSTILYGQNEGEDVDDNRETDKI